MCECVCPSQRVPEGPAVAVPPLSGSYRNTTAFSTKELALQSKVEADSIVTAGNSLCSLKTVLVVAFSPQESGWMKQDLSVVLHSDGTQWLAEAGQETPQDMLPYVRGCEEPI